MSEFNFEPRSQADREYHSYRTGGDRRHTRVAVEVEGGEFAEAQASVSEQILLELRAIRIGISLLVNQDLIEAALDEGAVNT